MYVKHLKKTDKGCRHTPSEKKILLKKFLRGKEEKDAEQIPHIHCRKCEELLQLPAIYYSFWMKIIYMLASIIISGSAFEVLLKLAINGAIDILPCVLIGFVWISLGNLIFDRGVMFILVLVGRWRAFKVKNQEIRRWIDVENHRYYARKKALNRMAKTGSAVAFLIIFILLKLDVRLSYAGIVFIVGIIIGLWMKKDFEGMKKSFCCLLMLGIMCVLNIVCPNVVIWMCTDVLSIVLVIVTAILADRFV